MPKKIKQKQKQSQYQKVVVNIGEVKKRKRNSKKRRHHEPSQDAREYAEAISKIIPKIQYNFPQHTSFNYDAYQTPNVVPQSRPNFIHNPIPLEQERMPRENVILGQNFGNVPIPIMDNRKSEQSLNIPSNQSSFHGSSIPLTTSDNITPIYKDMTADLESAKFEEKKIKIRKTHKPPDKILIDDLAGKNLPPTPENLQKAREEYLKRRETASASDLRKERETKLRNANYNLIKQGLASPLRHRGEIEPSAIKEEDPNTIQKIKNKYVTLFNNPTSDT